MIDIRPVSIKDVNAMCEWYHAYGGSGNSATYAFGVFELGVMVACYAWQPPPAGAAKSVCPEFPQGVLALSRMVAVEKQFRKLKHVSKPLILQMKRLIDRTRWPVLITYSDASVGHTGYVYQCSGFEKTKVSKAPVYVANGKRRSVYSNGVTSSKNLTRSGFAEITRWEHLACEKGTADEFVSAAGWCVVPIQGKIWKSGQQAHRVIKVQTQATLKDS